MSAVSVFICRVVVIADKIPAVHVVDVSVVVIVDAVSRNFTAVDIDAVDKIRMGQKNAAVKNSDDDIGVSVCIIIPGADNTNIGTGCSGNGGQGDRSSVGRDGTGCRKSLTGIIERPLIDEKRVGRMTG